MLKVTNLTCEYQREPLGLDDETPRFSWQLASSDRDVTQSAYRMQVFMEDGDKPIFDSGKVSSGSCLFAPYTGPPLMPRTRYRYRVRAWDARGRGSSYSDFAHWETGLMTKSHWSARWITAPEPSDAKSMEPPLRLRREFKLRAPVKRARIYASALGIYSLSVNVQPASDNLFAPGHTTYPARIQYQTYDVTALMREGKNAIAATVADGWYRGYLGFQNQKALYGTRTALIAQIHILYEDGGVEVLHTDESWRCDLGGPVRFADFYMGTHYDARLETPGWDAPDFDDSEWSSAAVLHHTRSSLIAQRDQPVRRTQALGPGQILHTPAGETVVDMGQNMVGFVRFFVKGQAGHTVSIDHAEVLDAQGNFYTENYRAARAELRYTLKGDPDGEWFEPDLTFYGFRYLRLNDWPGEPRAKDFSGIVVHSDLTVTAGFECSDERVNQLFQNILWGQRGNFVDVPTDCPQRDERLGWTGDCQVFARTACTLMDSGLMLTEWLRDLSFDQRSDGAVSHVVPHVLDQDSYGSAGWGDAAVIVPWTIYEQYGDTRVLRDQYVSMKAWLHFIDTQSQDYLWNGGQHFGDWLGLDARPGDYVGATDKTLIATAFYAHSAELVAQVAGVLKLEKDVQTYQTLHRNIVRAFRREFITATGRLAVRTQTAYVLTLQFDLAEEAHRPRMIAELSELIQEAGGHLTTGFLGTPYLCTVLTAFGRHDLAGQLFLKSDYPSWLYPITKGATTIWEHWDGIKPDGSFWSANMNSFNHYAYGAVGGWMMRALAGISMLQPAYAELLIHPRPIDGLNFVNAWQQTPYGRVWVSWRVDYGQHNVDVSIPAGTTALMVLEGATLAGVLDSGKPLSLAPGVRRAWQSDDDVMISLESGEYRFHWISS